MEDTLKTGKYSLPLHRAAALSTRKVLACGDVVKSSNLTRQTENLCFYVKPLNLYRLLINSVFQKDFE